MDDSDVIYADLWGEKAGKDKKPPADVLFVCAYQIFESIEYFEEAAFFRRTEEADELWTVGGFVLPNTRCNSNEAFFLKNPNRDEWWSGGRVLAVRRKGEELTACLNLMELLIRARYPYVLQEDFIAPGIVDKSAYDSLVGQIENEWEENRRKAQERETEIIKVARDLGLSPRPTGRHPDYWWAGCPGGRHMLEIKAPDNIFYCGYCRRKGGVEELRAFVKERRSGLKN